MLKVLTNIRTLVDSELVEALAATDFSKLTHVELEGYLMDIYCPVAQALRTMDSQANPRMIMESEYCLLGAQDPDSLITVVKVWNLWLKTNLSNLFTEWSKDSCLLNSKSTERILEGAHMANNEFVIAGGCRGLYLPNEVGCLSWSTVLSDEQLADICKNPGDYAILDIYV